MVKGETKTGFAFEVDENAINDMEIIDAFVTIQDGDPMPYTIIVRKLFGAEERKALYDHVRDEKGRVPIEKVALEINDIFEQIGESAKKS